MKIYFKTRKKIKNLEELIKNGYTNYSKKTFRTTYKNSKLTTQECHSARRSFEDLLKISRTYFPETTEKELAKLLFKLNEDINLTCSYCNTINKLVFYKSYHYAWQNINIHTTGYEDKKGKGKYSFNMIKELAK